MFVSFDKLPDQSRVWVYQAERTLNPEEQQLVQETGKQFMDRWASHGVPLAASIKVLLGYFLIIAVDDRQLPSGCSIDASVGLVRDLGNKLSLDFFGRNQIPLWIDDEVVLIPLNSLKSQLKQGEVPGDTLLINTLITQKESLIDWIMPIRESWLSRYLPQPSGNY